MSESDELHDVLAQHAACKDETDLFFSNDAHDVRMALAICRGCPVIAECREYVPEVDRGGYYGTLAGMTWQKRRGMERASHRRSLAERVA